MPGHNYIDSINEGTVRSHGGKILQVVAIGAAAPTAANVDMEGYATGAILINTNATTNKTTTTVYINTGTNTTATWSALTVS